MKQDVYSAITDFRKEMNDRLNKIEDNFVTNDRFIPIEKLVYGITFAVLVAVVGALLALVINKSGVQAR